MAARAFGASEVAITDLDAGRLALAAALAPGVVTVEAKGKGVRTRVTCLVCTHHIHTYTVIYQID